MSLQITTNINVDFYDKKYIMINAKQYDSNSRWISITCYSHGDLFNLSASKHTAYIRYRKADEHVVLNSCHINYRGEILVELTEQMLAADGICYVDLIIVNKGSAIVNIDTGEIVTVDGSAIISTMAFCVNVYESVVDNSLIESTYEYEVNALNDLLQGANASYQEVIQLARSYAIGDANDIRENEDKDNSKYYSQLSKSYAVGDTDGVRANESTDNAKYYYEQSIISMNNADESEANAKTYMDNANEYMGATESYMILANEHEANAKTHMDNASISEQNTKTYMDNALVSEQNAKTSEVSAANSEQNAKTSETNAATSEQHAMTSETNAKASETNALDSANSAKEYCEVVKSVVDGLNSGFIPMGTISFTELATAEKATGFTYNISDDFVTDERFAEGAGKTYTAGTNVYCRYDGLWDAFGGSASPTATVDEVKEYLGI